MEAAAAARVRVVDFFWAAPDPALVELAYRHGALACWQVGSPAEARAAADAGCDVVAVPSVEAGGHIRGQVELLESVIGQLDVPVLAARGIGDGGAFAAVLDRERREPGLARGSSLQLSRGSSTYKQAGMFDVFERLRSKRILCITQHG